MYSIIKQSDDIAYNVNEYICESVADLDSLSRCAPGSTAIIIENGSYSVYMKSVEGKWVKL